VITKTGRFKAAVSGASEANYLSNYGTDHYQYEWETELGLPWRNVDRWVKLSPWFAIENVTTPTLLMGGADDMNVPLLNSEQLYQALRRLGRETELVIYPGRTTASGARATCRTATSATWTGTDGSCAPPRARPRPS
jgi:dipeptidyl aminopeptidase/acylaminoacyl peptidase